MGTEQIKVSLIDYMGSDLTTVNAARVSFGKSSDYVYSGVDTNGPHEKALHKKDAQLIRYLASGMSSKDIEEWRNQMVTSNNPDTVMEAYNALTQAEPHMSPFGHAFASFHVKAPVFVARQLVKHKFLRWNEISRRYVDDEPEFYVPAVWRGRSADKKQGSTGEVDLDSVVMYENGGIIGPWYLGEEMREHWDRPLEQYNRLLKAGVAPEQARMVLPQSMLTEWWWSGSLDAFASMCQLRCKEDTQLESRIVANQISEMMGKLYPVSWGALLSS